MLSHQRPFSCYFTAPTTVPHRDSIQSGQRPERHDRIESGEPRVTPIMRKRIGIEHHARINNDRPRHRHIQCRRSGTIIDLRRTRERNLRVRHALLNRLERTGKIHRQRTLWTQNGSDDYVNASDVLRHAIEDNTISVLYQPIFDVNTKRITSLDTIVRVHDAQGRTLAPYFVTAEAHRLNMSVQLTLDVLETCVKDMTAFRQVAPELDIVDICMNGSELGASIFHERLEQLTHEQPQLRFGLQLGSHAIHVAHDEVDDEVADLAALPNVKLGLTNAGTTYSEVAAFAHLPLDFARFDKTVVRDFRTPRAKQIMQRTLDISRDNDAFHVVFDGVETLDQVEFIRSIGGTIAEGTLLSNAMSANEFLMRLETMGTALPEAAPRQAE